MSDGILITGSTDGLGRELARELAARGDRVLVHGRDQQKVERAAEEVGAGGSFVADLSSLDQVRRLAAEVLEAEDGLHALVNNAGLVSPERRLSEDGHELGFAVNYLAGFALTMRLVPETGRVVNVASIGQQQIDFEDVMLERGYEPFRSYAQSKLAQIMFTIELAERTGATANALHPATLMDTKMVRGSFGRTVDTVADGVHSVTHVLDLDPEVTGRFFDHTEESRANAQAYDAVARRRLWDLSERLTGVQS
jgi:NAD(P)-dependent dehydrogenase (short-subunit alcohol dehydrogenase family)